MDEYVAGGLPPAAAEVLEVHVEACADCREVLEEMRASDGLIRRYFREATEARVPDGFGEALSERLEALGTADRRKARIHRGWREWIPRWQVLAPTGTALAAAVFLAFFWWKGAQDEGRPMPVGGEIARLHRELTQIKQSIADMEAELESQSPNWR
jgi:anti-sigma factor RsiW